MYAVPEEHDAGVEDWDDARAHPLTEMGKEVVVQDAPGHREGADLDGVRTGCAGGLDASVEVLRAGLTNQRS